ncbi:hypothetical protein STHU_25230 [Allostella humosa]|nr:hypothetical protein STHU_25230 [Stella humosa]
MGWSVPDLGVTHYFDFPLYKAAAEKFYDGTSPWSSVRVFGEEAAVGDLVWFRNTKGYYYLAEITGPWNYYYSGIHISTDIVNYRTARILKVGLVDAVPGKVISCFRPPRTFQAIDSQQMLEYSSAMMGLKPAEPGTRDIFEYLSDEDLENLISIYLQVCGWYVMPGTRRKDTPHYEFVLVDRNTGKRGIVQVKSGHEGIDAAKYAGETTTFLFASCEDYGDVVPHNVTIIPRSKVLSFIRSQRQLLPESFGHWVNLVGL